MDAHQLQQLPAPTGELAGNSPESAGQAKIVGGEDTGGDNSRQRRPEFNKILLFEVLPGHGF